MPLKQSKVVINAQARKPILDAIDEAIVNSGIDEWAQIDNSFFAITNTDEGQRLVEVTAKVRELSIKPKPQADNITFATPQEMLAYLIAAKGEKVDKAAEKAAEKEKLKQQDIQRKAKLAEKNKDI